MLTSFIICKNLRSRGNKCCLFLLLNVWWNSLVKKSGPVLIFSSRRLWAEGWEHPSGAHPLMILLFWGGGTPGRVQAFSSGIISGMALGTIWTLMIKLGQINALPIVLSILLLYSWFLASIILAKSEDVT